MLAKILLVILILLLFGLIPPTTVGLPTLGVIVALILIILVFTGNI